MLRRSRIGWIALALVLTSPFALRAVEPEAQAPKAPLARVEIQPTRVDWLPHAAHGRFELRVAGPGDFYIQKELASDEAPSFSSLDGPAGRLADGAYSYELRAEGGTVQAGHLWVQDGRFVEPAAEPKPPLRNATAQTTVIADDLVVQGQACIGGDCVLGDTSDAALKIKEFGNLRIHFDAGCCHPSVNDWMIQATDVATLSPNFMIRDVEGSTIPFTITAGAPSDSLVILDNGNLGLGTSTPAQKLHLLGNNGLTQTLVEETNATTALRTLVQLKNNGDIRLNYTNTATGVTWGNNMIGGNYKMIKAGTGVTAFDLQGNGNLTIAGMLTQNSDRFTKHDIVPVQPEQILGKVLDLPIATWVRNGDEARHLGPMAQDFAAAFGLGEDDRHIATLDMAGVSLASIQALNGRMTTALAAKDLEIETLRRESSDLARRLAAMEKLVASLTEEATPQSQPAP